MPVGDNCEIDRLVLTNESDVPKSFTIFSYLEFCLWNAVDDSTNFQRNFSTGEVEVEGSTIYHKTEYRERRNHYALFTVNTPIDGFDTSRDAFLGAWHSNANPEVVENGRCTNSVAHGWAPVGVHQVNVTLQPGKSRSLIFVLGYIENPEDEKWAAPGVINKTRAQAMPAMPRMRRSMRHLPGCTTTGTTCCPPTRSRAAMKSSTAWSIPGTSTSAWSPST